MVAGIASDLQCLWDEDRVQVIKVRSIYSILQDDYAISVEKGGGLGDELQ
jgi:hypothetical protein